MVAEHGATAVDLPVLQIRNEIGETIQRSLQERISDHVVEQIAGAAKVMPDERLQQRTVEQVLEVAVRQIMEEIAEVVKLGLQERVRQHVADHVADVPARQVTEKTVKDPEHLFSLKFLFFFYCSCCCFFLH